MTCKFVCGVAMVTTIEGTSEAPNLSHDLLFHCFPARLARIASCGCIANSLALL